MGVNQMHTTVNFRGLDVNIAIASCLQLCGKIEVAWQQAILHLHNRKAVGLRSANRLSA